MKRPARKKGRRRPGQNLRTRSAATLNEERAFEAAGDVEDTLSPHDDVNLEREIEPEQGLAPEEVLEEATKSARTTGEVKADRRLQWAWWNLFRLRSQVTLSILGGIAVIVISEFARPLTFVAKGELTLLMSLLLGIASVLALVGSITFGFLLYYTQATTTERDTLYSRFQEAVRELRSFLDGLRKEGIIDDTYDDHFGLIDELTLKDFPVSGFGERLDPLTAAIEEQHDDLEEIGEFGRVWRGYAYRINRLEEVVGGFLMNFLRRVLVGRMTDPVIKSFVTLAIVMLAVVLAPLVYDLIPGTAAWAATTALGLMTVFLLAEIGLQVRREMKEFTDVGGTEGEGSD